VPGRGSAIFFHLAQPGFAPTAGCVAVSLPAMRQILARSGPGTTLVID
jgi:L,D-peptidoglycan transpeptidase YkuD (ErfK/YbiS/YcfS/YnhG family)